jgi:cbb3-type cytochrome oxidase maturation protein
MDILYLLVPLSLLLLLAIIGVFGWAVQAGQFDDLQREGERILDADQADRVVALEQSAGSSPAPAQPKR